MKNKALMPTLMLTLLSVFPASMGNLKFIPIYKALTIRANKKLPPHIAYLDTHFDSQDSEWSDFEKKPKQALMSGISLNAQQGPYVLTEKRVLEGFVIRKEAEIVLTSSERVNKTPMQISQETEGPRWLQNIVSPTAMATAPSAKDETPTALMAARRITGPIEITGGLAITNEHHIEVRHANEGVFHEMGRVDLMKGSYSIDVDDTAGAIVARLIDKNGAILGEGSVRLSQLQPGAAKIISGPRIEVAPSPSWTGNVGSYYPQLRNAPAPVVHVTTYNRENEVTPTKSGDITLANIVKGSSTVVRAESEGHMASNKIMVAGEDRFNMTMFPSSMMEALKNIVAANPEDAKATLDETSVVWGTVSLDGKPLQGVSVVSETEPDVKAVYFNEFMIPDPKLTATSSNGLYALVNLQDGFHALLAQRSEAYFGHQNVVVETGSVAIGDIQNTLRTEPVQVRAFDAFAGDPVAITANMQSLEQPLVLNDDGTASIILPQVNRLSMIYTEVPATYVPANYFYNDHDSYIHMPMVRKDWIENIKIESKVNEVPQTGTIVGFVSEENFEVYLAGQTKNSDIAIIYFDAAGRVISKGQAGGGFVIFNAPPGVQEPVVFGTGSEKIFSKVIPVDRDGTSVLNFTSY